MPFESCLCHFVGEWEVLFEIYVHFKELYICIWDNIGYHGNHCEGLLNLCNNLDGVYPNLVNIFWSFLYLISTEQCLFQCVQLHIWQWFMNHFRLKCGTMYMYYNFAWPFDPFFYQYCLRGPFLSVQRLILIPFRIHFESCWYNLSDNFLCIICMYQCI